jgi:hypothetical protein
MLSNKRIVESGIDGCSFCSMKKREESRRLACMVVLVRKLALPPMRQKIPARCYTHQFKANGYLYLTL